MTEIIAVHKNENDVFTCITDESRPHSSHAWARAASHIMRDLGLDYFVRLEASTACRHVVEAELRIPRPPRRGYQVQWGWGKGWPGQR